MEFTITKTKRLGLEVYLLKIDNEVIDYFLSEQTAWSRANRIIKEREKDNK